MQNSKTIIWSDSSTALTWIKREEQWGTFGPEQLKQCPEDWQQVEEHPDTKLINSEKRKTIVSALNVKDEVVDYFHRI